MALSDEEKRKRHVEYSRQYRKTHKDNAEFHRLRSKRYYDKHLRVHPIGTYSNKINIQTQTNKPPHLPKLRSKTNHTPNILLKKVVLTFYGGGKLACVKCGESDIDCLSLDHVNNDAHHRSGNGHVGGNALYRSLINRSFPKGYQTLCMNCNFKKSLEHLRKNGRTKQTIKDEILPLFKYFEDIAASCEDVPTSPEDVPTSPEDVPTSPEDVPTSPEDVPTSPEDVGIADVPYEVTHY